MDTHYKDQRLVGIYDVINPSRDDFEFYLRNLPKAPARILDIGCGTGSFAVELAGLGYQVTGVDPAAGMIDFARRRPGSNRVHWLASDVQGIKPHQPFDAAVMTGHAFQCLLSDNDVLGLFRSVYAHLVKGGAFWFETRNANAKPWQTWAPQFAVDPVTLADGRSLRVVQDVTEIAGELVTFDEKYEFSDLDEPIQSKSTLRFMPLPTITNIAAQAGLCVAETFGDWTGARYEDDSPEIIVKLIKPV
ncbi:MAG: class I SAM-dependent methyltransferase [Pseudomonadota bacterium]